MFSAKTWCVDNPDACLSISQTGISMGRASPVPLQRLKSAEGNPEPRAGLLGALGMLLVLGWVYAGFSSP